MALNWHHRGSIAATAKEFPAAVSDHFSGHGWKPGCKQPSCTAGIGSVGSSAKWRDDLRLTRFEKLYSGSVNGKKTLESTADGSSTANVYVHSYLTAGTN